MSSHSRGRTLAFLGRNIALSLGLSFVRRGLFRHLSPVQGDRIRRRFPLLPSFVPFSLSLRGMKIAGRCGSWCITATLRYFWAAHPRPIVVDDWLPPGPGKSFSAIRCARGGEL